MSDLTSRLPFVTQNSQLGTIAKIATPPLSLVSKSVIPQENDAALHRFNLQSMSRNILRNFKKLNKDDHFVYEFRVCNCLRTPTSKSHPVEVHYSEQGSSASLRGLQTCGSVWTCPVCSHKVTEAKLRELADVVRRWTRGGFRYQPHKYQKAADGSRQLIPAGDVEIITKGGFAMLTFTMRHQRDESLSSTWDAFNNAHRWMKKRPAFAKLKDKYGWLESVVGFELTHREANGFHPHKHEGALFRHELSPEDKLEFQSALESQWLAALAKFGRDGEHGIALNMVQGKTALARYMAKFQHEPTHENWASYAGGWSAERELVKSPSKHSANDNRGRSPFDLLALAGAGDNRARQLFAEYAVWSKGKHQLQWSAGAKLSLGVGLVSDELLAAADDDSIMLAEIEWDKWRKLLRLKTDVHSDWRGHLIRVARNGDAAAVNQFVRALVQKSDEQGREASNRHRFAAALDDHAGTLFSPGVEVNFVTPFRHKNPAEDVTKLSDGWAAGHAVDVEANHLDGKPCVNRADDRASAGGSVIGFRPSTMEFEQ